MTSGRPSIIPFSGLVKVIGGRGGAVAEVGCEEGEFMCELCAVDDEDELRATDEEEQAQKVNPLPTPFQPTLSQYLDHCITHTTHTSHGARTASNDAVGNFGIPPMRGSRGVLRRYRSTMHS